MDDADFDSFDGVDGVGGVDAAVGGDVDEGSVGANVVVLKWLLYSPQNFLAAREGCSSLGNCTQGYGSFMTCTTG